MLMIRLFRKGRKNQPFFKVVVTDKKNPPSAGRFLQELGYFNPLTKEKKLNAERILYWISKGAQPSETLHNMLVAEKIIEGTKVPLHKKSKKPPVEAAAPTPEAPVKSPVEPALEEKPQEVPAQEKKEETPASEPEKT